MSIVIRGLNPAQLQRRRQALLERLSPPKPDGASIVSEPTIEWQTKLPFPSLAAFRLLEVASRDWFRTKVQLYEAAGVNAAEGKKLIDELHAGGFVTKHPVKTFDAGGSIQLMLPTEAGLQVLRDANVSPGALRGDAPHGPNGDGTHIYYQNLIARKLTKQGWKAQIEQSLKSKRVDVGVVSLTALHAYEVVNEGLEKELSNLQQDLAEGWTRVYFCVGNTEIQRQLTALISDQIGDEVLANVEFCLLPSFR